MAIERSAKKSAKELAKEIPMERLIQMKLDFNSNSSPFQFNEP